MKTITILDYQDSTNWNLDEDVIFKIYGWFNCDLGLVPDFVNATHNYLRDTHQINYQMKRLDEIDKSKPWFIFLYTNFQYRVNYNDTEAINSKNLFRGIPEEVINELVNGNAHLILSCENEAITVNYFNLFHALYKNNPIVPADKITYITAAHNIHDLYDEYCVSNNIKDNEKMNIWYSHHGWLPWIKRYIKIYTDALPAGPRDKKFISLNRVPRSHRLAFVSLLTEYDLLKYGYVSLGMPDTGWPARENLISYITDHFPYWYKWEANSQIHTDTINGAKKLVELPPLRVDTEDLVYNWVGYELHPIPFLQRSYFSVVTGTNAFKSDEQGVTVNEKEFKAILCRHPFLLVSRPKTLSQLKAIGFKTFDQWFDESYDNEENDAVRLHKVVKEVERLCKISDNDWNNMLTEMSPIIEHNFNWLANHTEEFSFNFTDLKNLLKYAV